MLNVTNISNLTGEERTLVNTMATITFLVVVLGAGLTLIFPTKKWFGKQKMKFWTMILWIPYFALFVYGLTKAFPAIAAPMPTNNTILWVLGGTLIFYPFYILIVNLLSTK
jgi:hypothetical protein